MTFPKNYTKGEQTRTAHTAADAVRLEFEGFRASKSSKPAKADVAKAEAEDKPSSGKQAPESTPDKTVDTAGTPKPGPSTPPVVR